MFESGHNLIYQKIFEIILIFCNKFERKTIKGLKFFLEFLMKNRVRWNFNTVLGFKKNVLDRILGYKRTVLQEECLYIPKLAEAK